VASRWIVDGGRGGAGRRPGCGAPSAAIRDGKARRCRWVGIVGGSWGARPVKRRSEERGECAAPPTPCPRRSEMGVGLWLHVQSGVPTMLARDRSPSTSSPAPGLAYIGGLRSARARSPSSLHSHCRSLKAGARAHGRQASRGQDAPLAPKLPPTMPSPHSALARHRKSTVGMAEPAEMPIYVQERKDNRVRQPDDNLDR
jgi:hypothetical protein